LWVYKVFLCGSSERLGRTAYREEREGGKEEGSKEKKRRTE